MHEPVVTTAVAHREDRGAGLAESLPDWSEVIERVAALSARETQVFLLLGVGHSNRSIASRLSVTERTVKAHVAQILAKLDVDSRLKAGLAAFAYRLLDEGSIHTATGRH